MIGLKSRSCSLCLLSIIPTKLAVIVLLFVTPLVIAQTSSPPVAIVKLTKSEEISVDQLKKYVLPIERQINRTMTVEERRQALDSLIYYRLALQAAEKENIASCEEGEAGDAQKIESLLAKKYPDISPTKENRLKINDEAEKLYETHKSQLIRPEAVRLYVLEIPPALTDAEQKKRAGMMGELAQEIGGNPDKFDKVYGAKAKKTDRIMDSFPYDGPPTLFGTTIYVTQTEETTQFFGEDFMKTVFSLRANEVSQVLVCQGFHYLVKVREILPQKMLGRYDYVQLGESQWVIDWFRNLVLTQKREEAEKKLIAELQATSSIQVIEKNLVW